MFKIWLAGMGEISGFGGIYEEACRTMFFAGLTWLETHPEAKLKSNEDTNDLSKAITNACPIKISPAMLQIVLRNCLYVHKFGCDKYIDRMRRI